MGATFDVVKGVALFAGYATAFRAPFGFIGTCRRCRRQRATSRAG
ncbi:hypothetical protein [Sphingomonas melonis]